VIRFYDEFSRPPNHWGKPDGVTAVTPSFNMDASQADEQDLLDYYVIKQVEVVN